MSDGVAMRENVVFRTLPLLREKRKLSKGPQAATARRLLPSSRRTAVSKLYYITTFDTLPPTGSHLAKEVRVKILLPLERIIPTHPPPWIGTISATR